MLRAVVAGIRREDASRLALVEPRGHGGGWRRRWMRGSRARRVRWPDRSGRSGRLPSRLAAVEEWDTTCCYARQDKFWVTGAPSGERWEIYTAPEDSPTFWGQDGSQSWDAAEAALDETPGASDGGYAVQCCGGPQAVSLDEPTAVSRG
jgi:hypothetical protein